MRRRNRATEPRGAILRLAVSGALALLLSDLPAAAQVTASVGVDSAYRFRGRSLSARRPVATADLGYDDKSGLYLGGSTAFTFTGPDPGLLLLQADIGYARKLAPNLSLDLGVTRTEYTHRRGGSADVHYTELYAGLSLHTLSARLYYSPDYLASGVGTLYGESNWSIEPVKNWSLSAHAGKLVYVANRPAQNNPSGYYDWSLGVSRRLGKAEAHVALSGGGPGEEYYGTAYHSRTGLTVGVSYAF